MSMHAYVWCDSVASSEGHLEVCEFLLQEDADVSFLDRWGNGALDDAIRGKHDAICAALVAAGDFTRYSAQQLSSIHQAQHQICPLHRQICSKQPKQETQSMSSVWCSLNLRIVCVADGWVDGLGRIVSSSNGDLRLRQQNSADGGSC